MKHRSNWILATMTTVTVALLGSSPATAASFDCAKALSRIENVICASASVSALDSDLHDAYTKALSQTPDAEALKAAQRDWIKTIRNACKDESCLANVYQQRIATLTGSVATTPADTTPTAANTTQENGAAAAVQATSSPLADTTTPTAEAPAAVPTEPAPFDWTVNRCR